MMDLSRETLSFFILPALLLVMAWRHYTIRNVRNEVAGWLLGDRWTRHHCATTYTTDELLTIGVFLRDWFVYLLMLFDPRVCWTEDGTIDCYFHEGRPTARLKILVGEV